MYYIINVSLEITIYNENDFINNINKNNIDSLILNIEDNEINVSEEININYNIKSLSIIGNSIKKSVITFNNKISGLIFNDNIQNIKLKNITINGYLEFKNNKKIEIENIVLNGSINVNKEKNNYGLFEFINSKFKASTELKNNCIELYGNVLIKNSEFFGNNKCMDYIINYKGENLFDINIYGSYFNGKFSNSCLHISEALYLNVTSSKFLNGENYRIGGYYKFFIKILLIFFNIYNLNY